MRMLEVLQKELQKLDKELNKNIFTKTVPINDMIGVLYRVYMIFYDVFYDVL